MRKYRYNGVSEVELTGVGIVQPGAIFETENEINNADCELLEASASIVEEPTQQERTQEEEQQEVQTQE